MVQFDLSQEPLTGRELRSELDRLKALRKEQIKLSCISDVLHAFVFITLYFGHFLSGTAALVAVGIGTGFAIFMALSTRHRSRSLDRLAIGAVALLTAGLTVMVLFRYLQQQVPGSLIAGCAAASSVIAGATLGRKVKQVMLALEEMKPIVDDETAQQELAWLCRTHPELEDYRDRATINLRPHLCYGELAAMRRWHQRCSTAQARSKGS